MAGLIAVPLAWDRGLVFIPCDRCGQWARARPWMRNGWAGECYRCGTVTYQGGDYDLPF